MSKKKRDTKERLIKSSIELFRSKGFSGAGLKEIVANAEAPWGSLYHFFPEGKEQLGAEVVAFAGEKDNEQFQLTFAKHSKPMAAIKTVFKAEARRMETSDYLDGCTVASVASDIAASSERVRSACSEAFSSWEETIQNAFIEDGRTKAESRTMATFVLSCLEGATLLARSHKSIGPFKDNLKMIELALEKRD